MRSATILIIDDQESVRMMLKRALEDAGYQVAEAANGRQGLERFRATPADLVITDLAMTEMNGLELILELTRAFLDVKVIAVSGDASDGLQAAKLLGARQTFPKPFDLSALLRAVDYELKH